MSLVLDSWSSASGHEGVDHPGAVFVGDHVVDGILAGFGDPEVVVTTIVAPVVVVVWSLLFLLFLLFLRKEDSKPPLAAFGAGAVTVTKRVGHFSSE